MAFKGRKKTGMWLHLLLSAAVLLAALSGSVISFAESTVAVESPEYLVKYRDSEASLMHEDAVPFDVVEKKQLDCLLREDALEWYEEDGYAVLMDTEGDISDIYSTSEYYGSAQWNLALINADVAFRNHYLGQGIRIGVLDSGVSPHPAFGNRLCEGHNFIEDAEDPEDTHDEFGHGTKVAGLIAAVGESGYIGAAPEASLVPLKCTDGKTAKISTICRAIYSGIDDYDCDILNLSLGVSTEYQSLKEAVDYAAERGVVMVSAVGNGGSSVFYYPAKYDSVIGVGTVDRYGACYERSNHNSSVFLTAPGVSVLSTDDHGGYSTGMGCSFAVPQVSAASAVMKSIDSTMTPEKIARVLSETAMDRGKDGYDEYYGFGILNLGKCVETLMAGRTDQEKPKSSEDNDSSKIPEYNRCLKDKNCVLAAFSDLDRNAWYHDGIHYVLQNGIMKGYGNGKFGPGDVNTRAMIVTMLWRMEGSPDSDNSMIFQDVTAGQWYTEAIRWAVSKKIVTGYNDRIFGPDDEVNREQLAAILWRYAVSKGRGNENDFDLQDNLGKYTDTEQVSSWALDAMRWAVNAGIIQGLSEAILSPKSHAVRAQTATMFMRFEYLI